MFAASALSAPLSRALFGRSFRFDFLAELFFFGVFGFAAFVLGFFAFVRFFFAFAFRFFFGFGLEDQAGRHPPGGQAVRVRGGSRGKQQQREEQQYE